MKSVSGGLRPLRPTPATMSARARPLAEPREADGPYVAGGCKQGEAGGFAVKINSSLHTEKILHQSTAFVRTNPIYDFHLVI
jgi:hypothetical protein